MIHRIYSTLSTFKPLEFKEGLNVLIAKKSKDATLLQTRNRAGKTSLIEIVHFLMGADIKKDSLFKADALKDVKFGMDFDLSGEKLNIERINKSRSGLILNGESITAAHWRSVLGQQMFGLTKELEEETGKPTFRSIFPYFARRIVSGAFMSPEKQAIQQDTGSYQMALMFLLGLDWKIASDWQKVRDKEKKLKELKKAAKEGDFSGFIGTAAELRTELTVAQNRLSRNKAEAETFRVHPQYRDLEKEADQITKKLAELANENTIDFAIVRDLEAALDREMPPELDDLHAMYEEVGVVLPSLIKKRYDDVRSFHESVIHNRKDYLSTELGDKKSAIEDRRKEEVKLDERRSEIMRTLKSHGALDQFTRLQAEIGRLESEAEILLQKYETAEQLEGTKSELDIERNRLLQRLKRDFVEQKSKVSDSILSYQEVSEKLYEDAGSMYIDDTTNGPNFNFEIQGSRSRGIKNMQIFCFDMMLMQICSKRKIGPDFLMHDSHMFDGVDGRQVISALHVGAEIAEVLDFQYIVTMNEDDAFKETEDGFDLGKYVLNIKLTDATESGGLFGFRFE